jgi:ribosomal protein S18 acetylase RimI-like enzyme
MTTTRPTEGLEAVEVLGGVDRFELVAASRPGIEGDQALVQPNAVQAVEHRSEAGRSFGVARPRVVVAEAGMGGEQDRGHPLTVATLPPGVRGRSRILGADDQGGALGPAGPGPEPMTATARHRALRIRPWPVDPTTAHLVPYASRRLSSESLRRILADLAAAGYRRARTAALSPDEQEPFLAVGFAVDEHLHLLAHDLEDVDPVAHPSWLRRGGRRDREAILAVDALAFAPPWRLDAGGLRDAQLATPTSRLRVAAPERTVVGYTIAGRAGCRGYLQRVAVHPDHTNRGLGRVLVLDALGWLRRRGARQALVNTQEHNATALHLYEAVGFRSEPGGLDVLGAPLP